ncbi:MAG TPA: RAD55 family ATPase [Nitrososphaerales archaeon]|nr:RAD55 family ATPase [Nitrososphaerales archaeon]
MVSTGVASLDQILNDGYPDRSSVLVLGQSGLGKQALGYSFVSSGLKQGDYCLYVTHKPVSDIIRDMKGFGVAGLVQPEWIASSGSPLKCDLRDATSISYNVKQALQRNSGRRVRVVTDVLSPLLVLNPSESMYSYWSQLADEVKKYDAVLLALGDEEMHTQATIASMEHIFDGVIELKLFEEGLTVTPVLRVKQMLGMPPQHGWFRFSFSHGIMEVTPNVAK